MTIYNHRTLQRHIHTVRSAGSLLAAVLPFTAPGIQTAQAKGDDWGGYVITHNQKTEQQALKRLQKEQARAFKEHQRLEASYVKDKHLRHKMDKREKEELKRQQKLQKEWLKQHQWSQTHPQ
ncbi:MAG: hypothetical protein JO316_03805 [Abitibacteriaceae bacterium]|nr:hypothetical protein [Abditibacteriaceae bacterium]MBV9864447.1 hypothetical protein [Abditibacteriaceae bacterium]